MNAHQFWWSQILFGLYILVKVIHVGCIIRYRLLVLCRTEYLQSGKTVTSAYSAHILLIKLSTINCNSPCGFLTTRRWKPNLWFVTNHRPLWWMQHDKTFWLKTKLSQIICRVVSDCLTYVHLFDQWSRCSKKAPAPPATGCHICRFPQRWTCHQEVVV